MTHSWWPKLVQSQSGNSRRDQRRRPRNGFQPWLETLEDRMAPAVFVVNTTADTVAANLVTGQDASGNIRLRSAIQAANNLGGTNPTNPPPAIYNPTISPSPT